MLTRWYRWLHRHGWPVQRTAWGVLALVTRECAADAVARGRRIVGLS